MSVRSYDQMHRSSSSSSNVCAPLRHAASSSDIRCVFGVHYRASGSRSSSSSSSLGVCGVLCGPACAVLRHNGSSDARCFFGLFCRAAVLPLAPHAASSSRHHCVCGLLCPPAAPSCAPRDGRSDEEEGGDGRVTGASARTADGASMHPALAFFFLWVRSTSTEGSNVTKH